MNELEKEMIWTIQRIFWKKIETNDKMRTKNLRKVYENNKSWRKNVRKIIVE